MSASFPPSPDNCPLRPPALGGAAAERRSGPDRRRRFWWSLLYGGIHPRRRRAARRVQDGRYHALDWHGTHLWAASIGILIMSVLDAFLTVTLMSGGAVEVNPFMALFVGGDPRVFVALKMGLTGVCVAMMVFLARHRFMRLVRVDVILYGIFLAYAVLIRHELGMLRRIAEAHL